jgi:pyridoxamine 5'-phosphate oxidase
VAQLQQDHTAMEAAWAALRVVLAAWADPAAAPELRAPQSSASLSVRAFAAHYQAHIACEESLVYPCVEALVSAQELESMGRAMSARRGAVI